MEKMKVIRIEPSSLCNLRCIHCPTGTTQAIRGNMAQTTYSKILENIDSETKVAVMYHGGEPLLNKAFPSVVRKLKQKNIPFVKTVSNGMLLNDSKIRDIVKYGLDAIEISLDGRTPEENNIIRQNCDCKKVIKNINSLIRYKQKTRSTTPVISIATTQFIKDISDCDRIPETPSYLIDAFPHGEVEFKSTYAMAWAKTTDDRFKILEYPHNSNYCDHVMNTVTIRWNGDVVPCCYDLNSDMVMGNINEDSLTSIWNNEKYQTLRSSIQKRKFNANCLNCGVVQTKRYLKFR